MRVLAHRGWWDRPSEKNSRGALARALASGYGVETDIRDASGELVISHDIPLPPQASNDQLSLKDFLDLYVSFDVRPVLALNIKSDGLAEKLHQALRERAISNYFVFDMSIPDSLSYLNRDMRVFTRRSEFETASRLDERAQGLWLDKFSAPELTVAEIEGALATGKEVAIVSPELHGRPYRDAWEAWSCFYLALQPDKKSRLHLCTDLPDAAQVVFGKLQ